MEDDESRKCGGKCGINNNLCRTLVISVNYGFGDGVMTVANAKSSPESGKFALQIISESGKLLTIGCHFPSKSINFGTPSFYLRNIRRRNGQKSYKEMDGLYFNAETYQYPACPLPHHSLPLLKSEIEP